MNIETLRIASFEHWPSDAGARPIPLAAAGFYHSGGPNSLEVTCFSCGLSVSRWEPHQDPRVVHRQMAPHCPFLQGNIALPENISAQDDNYSLEECSRLLQSLGSKSSSPPNPDRNAVTNKRKATYYDWSYGHCQSASALAAAGFFFTGVEDKTQCAFCRGVLRSWESTDNPLEEHKRHFPSCQFCKWTSAPVPSILSFQSSTFAKDGADSSSLSDKAQGATSAFDIRRATRARMDTEMVKSVVQMGYPTEIVRKVIENRLLNVGHAASNGAAAQEESYSPSMEEDPKSTNSRKSREDLQSLLQENEEMKEQSLCKVCMANDSDVIFLPCGHFVCCSICASALTYCPICRTPIKGTVRVYRS
ncbi:hypothetical protein CAPTEDRAFT_64177, partial [Capitella teleta]